MSLLMQGAKRIARERDEEERSMRRAAQIARSRFDQAGSDGILESELIEYVEQKAGVTLDIAAYVVDELRANGVARKVRSSGLLFHTAP